MERLCQAGNFLLNLAGQCGDLCTVGKLHILFAEIQLQLHQCHEVQQPLAQCSQLAAESATHLVQRQPRRCLQLCGDDIGHRLGLRQIEASCHHCPSREFAAGGHAASGIDERGQQLLLNPS